MPDLLERLRSAVSDHYAIEREIGRGGMATVYLAEDTIGTAGFEGLSLLPPLTAGGNTHPRRRVCLIGR